MLAEFISKSGKSRAAFAERIGISRSYLSEILSGKRRHSLVLAVSIERETCGEVPTASWVDAGTRKEASA
ncbi:XRE family transcriptional regulator [Sinirhodobacter ferrireducens]|uniref:XRE family transcriptional regulator n=1 Tax=Paenirhodobacter ferrireducens TaxID=1215032 RepID=A0A443LJV6_9RHOB|nr:XRE family transcriptional regulator [Sinirhodobacter ferrireducens]